MDESSNRMGRLLFKMAVEQAVISNILAAVCEVNQQELKRLRGQCVQEIGRDQRMLSLSKHWVAERRWLRLSPRVSLLAVCVKPPFCRRKTAKHRKGVNLIMAQLITKFGYLGDYQ